MIMSYDRHLDQTCTHFVVEEVVSVEDFRIVRPKVPVAAVSSFQLKLDRLLEVPSHGAYLPALAKGSVKGPFTVVAGSNELRIRMEDGSISTLILPPSQRVTVDRVVDMLGRQIETLKFYASSGKVFLQSLGSGPLACFEVLDSPLATLLGLTLKVYRGLQQAPGWSLVEDPTQLFTSPYRYVLFDTDLKTGDSFAEVTYTTSQQHCRRCLGSGLEFDWRYDRDGNTGEVRDDALLLQEFLKLILTVLGSNPFHRWYGTTLTERIGSKIVSGQAIQAAISADIAEAFRRWQVVKKSQEDKVGQFVSDDEFPFRLLGVSVSQDEKDPTVIYVSVRIQKRSGSPVDFTRGFKLPSGSVTAGLFRQTIGQYQRV